MQLSKEHLSFLEQLANAYSPTGFERKSQRLWLDYVSPFVDRSELDPYANAYAVMEGSSPFKVLIESHADEISWIVSFIDDNGFVYVIRNGLADAQVAVARHVTILTSKGAVDAIFSWPSQNVRDPEIKPDSDHMYLDCGCSSREEVEKLGVAPGNAVVFDTQCRELRNGLWVGRALDNRVGGFILSQVARELSENKKKLPFTLHLVNAVMEEAGGFGAGMAAKNVNPDLAIIVDVTDDTSTPFANKQKHGDVRIGKGPGLVFAPSIHNGMLHLIMTAAERASIPYQRLTISDETETDTERVATAVGGVCTALISPPLRYMHTPTEIIHIRDIENTISLILETLHSIDVEKKNWLEYPDFM